MSSSPFSESALASMTYGDLQSACMEAGVGGRGCREVLLGRLRNHTVPRSTDSKRRIQPSDTAAGRCAKVPKESDTAERCAKDKAAPSVPVETSTSVKDVAADLKCPITRELMLDPVTADDGRMYEREAMEEHIRRNGAELKSPMDNKPMDSYRLMPQVQVRNTIEILVETHVIVGDLAITYLARREEKKQMKILLEKANGGDLESMVVAGVNYDQGNHGFAVDIKKAHSWFEKSHNKGDVRGTVCFGYNLVIGRGCSMNRARGMLYIGMAAERGSDVGAYHAGMFLAKNDKDAAIEWLKKALGGDCRTKHLAGHAKTKAKNLLLELTAEEVIEISDDGSE